MEKGRLEGLSDNVFAVAMTILVFDLRLPSSDAKGGFAKFFDVRWPHYLAFVITFALIAMIWVRHHWIFRQLRILDSALLVLNMALLALIIFLPFTTSALASYLRADTRDELLAVLVYGLAVVAVSVVLAAMWLWASTHRNLLHPGVSDDDVRRVSKRVLVSPLFYVAGFAISSVSVATAMVVYVLIALSYLWQPQTGADRASVAFEEQEADEEMEAGRDRRT